MQSYLFRNLHTSYHAATIANTLATPILVFTRMGSMAIILSHYRPCSTIFAFKKEKRVKQRLMLYHGVMPIYMEFSDDARYTSDFQFLMPKNNDQTSTLILRFSIETISVNFVESLRKLVAVVGV